MDLQSNGRPDRTGRSRSVVRRHGTRISPSPAPQTNMSFALDVNILLYASDTGSPHFERSKTFIESCIAQKEVFYVGWPTLIAYLRIATHPSVFDRPLSPDEAM